MRASLEARTEASESEQRKEPTRLTSMATARRSMEGPRTRRLFRVPGRATLYASRPERRAAAPRSLLAVVHAEPDALGTRAAAGLRRGARPAGGVRPHAAAPRRAAPHAGAEARGRAHARVRGPA